MRSVTPYLLLTLMFLATATSIQTPHKTDSPDSETQLTSMNSKIDELETQIKARSEELKLKDELIHQKEKNILEKSNTIASLKTELSSLEEKGKLDAGEKAQMAQDRADDLDKEVKKLRKNLLTKNGNKEALESRVRNAEKKITDLNGNIKKFEKTNVDQKARIRETAKALKIAEDELIMVKLEASKASRNIKEVKEAWLPPWLTEQYMYYQGLVQSQWTQHGKPSLDMLVEKALDTTAQANRWAEPHIITFKTKWVPAVMEHAQVLTTKAADAYGASKTAISPHLMKAQGFVKPYYQKVKKVSEPYIEQVASTAKPHVQKIRLAMKPTTKKVSIYHRQVRLVVTESLGQFDLTKPLAASNEFVWYTASALLALPVFIILRSLSELMCQKTKKPSRNARSHHSRRKTKRGHSDK